MSREELSAKLANTIQALQNAQNSLQFTNIPTYVLINYILKETNINLEKVK